MTLLCVEKCRRFELSNITKKENIPQLIFLLLFICLVCLTEEKGRGDGKTGKSDGETGESEGKKHESEEGFICFGEGCSALDITLTCLTLALIIIAVCHCLRKFVRCCDLSNIKEEEQLQPETV